jgi:hypothetical protein
MLACPLKTLMIGVIFVGGVLSTDHFAFATEGTIKLKCDFLKPELRGGNLKFQGTFHIDMKRKKVRAHWETPTGNSVVNFKITQINEESIHAILESLEEGESQAQVKPIIIDRYALNVLVPYQDQYRVGECIQIKKEF